MRLPRFEYLRPDSVGEASAMLMEEPTAALAVAGGTDVLVAMKQRITSPRQLVGLSGIQGLGAIEVRDGTLRIGALVTLSEIVESQLVQDRVPLLAQAAMKAASPQIRNLATIGGNLCLSRRCWYYNQSLQWRKARPPCLRMGGAACYVVRGKDKCYALHCADTIPALLALEANVKLVSTEGERTIPLDGLYSDLGPDATNLKPGEILTEVLVPYPGSSSCGVYLKHSGRPSIDFPLAGVAVAIRLKRGKAVCEDARVSVGAACPRPMRLSHGEETLRGETLSAAVVSRFVEVATAEVKPIPYIYSSPGYKRKVVGNLLLDAVEQAWQLATSV